MYITRKRKLAILHRRAVGLLNGSLQSQATHGGKRIQRFDEIHLYALGAAIPHAVRLALMLEESEEGTLECIVETYTVQLHDRFEPGQSCGKGEGGKTVVFDGDIEVQSRNNSAIKITVRRKSKRYKHDRKK